MPAKPRPRPCPSCPYRRDVPSGVWAAVEYDRLTDYDGDATDQALSPHGMGSFHCHTTPESLCSGWVAHRDPQDLLALRVGFAMGLIDASAFTYKTTVALWSSGAEAAEHGKREIEDPSPEARELTAKIVRIRPDVRYG